MVSEALQHLRASFNDAWPNDKDLISSSDFLKVQFFGGYYLLADDKGYLGYVESLEDLKELIHVQSLNPGSLRINAPVHDFKSRGFKTKRKEIDIDSIDL